MTGLNFGITSNEREIPDSSDSKVTNDDKHKQKFTNFGDVFIVDQVVCGKSDGNLKDADGQV